MTSYRHERQGTGWVVIRTKNGKETQLPVLYGSEFPASRRAEVLNHLAQRRECGNEI